MRTLRRWQEEYGKRERDPLYGFRPEVWWKEGE